MLSLSTKRTIVTPTRAAPPSHGATRSTRMGKRFESSLCFKGR